MYVLGIYIQILKQTSAIISEISMLKKYVKNEDFHILDTFVQRPLKLFNYQSYQYIGCIIGYLMI